MTTEFKNFWKPIEDCPKEEGKYYFLLSGHYIIVGTWARTHLGYYWIDQDGFNYYHRKIFHYAEIPPLSEKGEQS